MSEMFRSSILAAALAVLAIGTAQAQSKPIVYPAKGQSPQQQQKDDGECYTWAKSSTGIDPAAVSAQPAPPPPPPGGERVRGAARGAVGGAAIGAIAGDSGHGAAAGAVVGTMAGGAKSRKNQQAHQQNAQAQKQGAIDTYYRAHSACMEGRGYTIK
jgi:hypothetical protein